MEANLQTYRGSSTERRLLEQRIRQATAARRREARVLAGGKDHVRLNAGLPSPRRVHSARTTRPAKIVMPEPGTSAAAQLEKRMAELEQEAEEMFRRAAAERQDAERKAQAAEAAKVARQSPRGGAAPTAGPTAAQAARHTAPEADGATPRPSGLGAAVLADGNVQASAVFQQGIVPRCCGLPGGKVAAQVLEFHPEDGRLQTVQSGINADDVVVVLLYHAVIGDLLAARRNGVIGGDNSTAVAHAS